MRSLRLFTCALALVAGLVFASAIPVFAQGPAATPTASAPASPTPGPTTTATTEDEPSAYEKANWSKYMAWALAGIGAAVLGMAALGYLVQGPGFRKLDEEEAE